MTDKEQWMIEGATLAFAEIRKRLEELEKKFVKYKKTRWDLCVRQQIHYLDSLVPSEVVRKHKP